MKEIQLKDAKATLSRVVDEVLAGEAAVITRHGRKEAVMISWTEFQRLNKVPSFGWLVANSPLQEDDIAERKPARALTNPF
jgi:antitoxin Phd